MDSPVTCLIKYGSADLSWDEKISALGSPFSLMKYLSIYEELPGRKVVRCIFKQGETEVGWLAGIIFISTNPLMRLLEKVAQFESLPLLASYDAELMDVCLEALSKALKSEKITKAHITTMATPHDSSLLKHPKIEYKEKRVEFHWDLTLPETELLAGMRKAVRRDLLNLQDLKIENSQDPEYIDLLFKLSMETAERHRARGERFTLKSKDDFIFENRRLLERDLAELFLCREGDEILNIILCRKAGKHVYYSVSASSIHGLERGSSRATLWFAARYFKEKGFTGFTLGGCSRYAEKEGDFAHGLYLFKKRFGTKACYCDAPGKIYFALIRTGIVYLLRKLFQR